VPARARLGVGTRHRCCSDHQQEECDVLEAGILVLWRPARGWIAGLLTAPAAGDETRRRLSWKLDAGRNKVRREAQRAVEQTAARLEHGIEAGKQRMEQALSS
jgi:hypothetical protein